jgi:lysozyme
MKKRNTILLVIILFILVFVSGIYFGLRERKEIKQEQQALSTFYPAFGISIPTNYTIHGIDVSNYQQFIAWSLVKQMKIDSIAINFVFIKATEGLKDTDKRFKKNWEGAGKDSLTRGAYHFFLATKSGRKQAENFIKNVKLEKGDLPPVLDIENLYGVQQDSMRSRIKQWLTIIENHYKVKPIIYSYAYFYEDFLGKDFDEYPLWVAHYDEKEKPRIKRNWLFWQHNEKGHVNGITSTVDFNVFKGDSLAFNSLLIH